MRSVKLGFLMAAAMCVIGPSTAWACTVYGTVVCQGTDQPVAGVELTFVDDTTERLAPATDASGDFNLDLWGATWDVFLDDVFLKSVVVWDIDGQPWTLWDPIEVPASLVPACAPQEECVLTVLEGDDYTSETARPLGRPDAECEHFQPGSVSIGGGYGGTVDAPLATMDAAFAVVKAGRNYYAVTVDVEAGDALLVPDTKNAVSHVTYCSCPTQSASLSQLESSTPTSGGCSTGGAGALALMGLAPLLARLRRRRG